MQVPNFNSWPTKPSRAQLYGGILLLILVAVFMIPSSTHTTIDFIAKIFFGLILVFIAALNIIAGVRAYKLHNKQHKRIIHHKK